MGGFTVNERNAAIGLLRDLNEQHRRLMEKSLYEFVKASWEVVEPGKMFVDNWHIKAICEHLQAVSEGKIKRLLINVPFRTMKSTIVSVMWPAWVWINKPHHQWLCGSYVQPLAIRDALKMRRLVTSNWYTSYWPGKIEFAKDQNEKKRYQNSKGGYRIAFGLLGQVMGDGGDTILIDDPHDRSSAESDVQRETALETYDGQVVSRLNDPNSSAIVIIMQRLHENDLSGHVMKGTEHWVHLMLPMEFEPERKCRTSWEGYSFEDPRKTAGELLWPRRFSRITVENLKIRLGEYGAAGQLQQRPAPAGGGILQVKYYQLWPFGKELPIFDYILQSYDTAFTDDTANDPVACTVWGIFKHTIDAGTDYESTRACALLLDAWTDHLKYPQLKKRMMEDWKAQYGGHSKDLDPLNTPRRPDAILVEEKGSGISVRQDMQHAGIPVMAYNPGKASKTARAALTAPMLEAETYYVIEGRSREPGKRGGSGKPIKWAEPLLLQEEQFPNGEHDDLVDTHTQANILLQRSGWLELPTIEPDPVSEVDYHAKKRARINPYG